MDNRLKMNSIMKRVYLFSLAALVLGLTACDNYFDEKYLNNADATPAMSKTTYDYDLSYTDYQSIASSQVNKKIAADLDSINGLKNRYQKALQRVGEEGCFNQHAKPEKYIPAFLSNKYPQVDPGAVVNTSYLSDEGLAAYLLPYNEATRYVLTAADYEAVWSDDQTPYLTPATEAQVTKFLPQPEEGQMIGVIYNYSSTEPNANSEYAPKQVLYYSEDGYTWAVYVAPNTYDFQLLPLEANGQVINWLKNTYPYAVMDQEVVVMWYNEDFEHYVAYEYDFDGMEWNANVGIEDDLMMFVLDASKGWITDLSTYYKQAVAGEGDYGKITLCHYDLQDGITYIWRYDNLYGMRGSSYAGSAHYGEGWFVTPKIKLKSSVSPALSFDHAINYGPLDETRAQQLTVWVSTDYKGDAHKATWTQLPWNEWDGNTGFIPDNSWTFYNSGRMDLSQWNNQSIFIGFRYKTEAGQTCPTWEVKNLLVNEP